MFATTIAEQRATLRTLRVRAQRAHEEHNRLLDADDELAIDALRVAVRIGRDASDLEAMVAAADARLAGWPTAPAVNAALDFYRDLRDAVAGRTDIAETIVETNAALRTVLEDASLAIRGDQLWGEFFVRTDDRMRIGVLPRRCAARSGSRSGGQDAAGVQDAPDEMAAWMHDESNDPVVGRTERQTFLQVPLWTGVPLPPLEVEIG